MRELKKVIFRVADADAEEQLIREYISPAFQRIKNRNDAQWPIFNRYAQDPSTDNGEVILYIFGNAEFLASEEKPHWNELVVNDLVLSWQTADTDVQIDRLDEQERLRYRLRSAASQMSLEFFELFDSLPDSLDEFDDEEYQVGWGLCLHHLINQLGYQANGGEEEIDLLYNCLMSRLYAMAMTPEQGPESAEEKVEELLNKLQTLPSEFYQLNKRN